MVFNWNQKNFTEAVTALIKTGTAEEAEEFIQNIIRDFVEPYGKSKLKEEIFWIVTRTEMYLKMLDGSSNLSDYYKVMKPLQDYAEFFETTPGEFPDLCKPFLDLVKHFNLRPQYFCEEEPSPTKKFLICRQEIKPKKRPPIRAKRKSL